jgi:hypothetical protein
MTRKLGLILTLVGLVGFAGLEIVQGQTTVQLPQFRRFQVSGSVMVPDGGSTYLGGLNGSGVGSRQYGALPIRPLANRTTGGGFNRAGVVTTVETYSLREMEAQLMGQLSPEYQQQRLAEAAADQAKVARQLAADQAAFREMRRSQAEKKVELAKADVRWARKFAADGNHLAADLYYRRAIKELPADLRELAEKEHRRFLDSSGNRIAASNE